MGKTQVMKKMRIRPALAALVLGASLVLVATGGLAAARSVTVVGRVPATPMVLQNVSLVDLVAERHGICDGSFTHVIWNSSGSQFARGYLDAAAACGLKVIIFFGSTANHSTGTVSTQNVAFEVNNVKSHPALWGYLTVKEPAGVGITASEIKSLYTAFKAADPNHPVMALFGNIPNFGKSSNPYTSGMADVVMVDWYPVETGNKGSSSTGTYYQPNGPTHFVKVRNAVRAVNPETPIWLMVQTHKYLAPATHKKQRPTDALLRRQVREGLATLGAKGIAFHTWSNTNYQSDQTDDPKMVDWMKKISLDIRRGTFN